MYYYDEVVTNIEDLLMDFLTFRKSRKTFSQSKKPKTEEILKNFHFKKFAPNFLNSQELPTEIQNKIPKVISDKTILDAFPKPLDVLPTEITDNIDEEYMQLLMGEINSTLMPYVMEVLNSYEYTGSPIFDDQIDRETIAQIIDRVLEVSQEEVPAVNEIQTEPERQTWVRYQLLRAIVESMVLSELFLKRRPLYRMIRTDSF